MFKKYDCKRDNEANYPIIFSAIFRIIQIFHPTWNSLYSKFSMRTITHISKGEIKCTLCAHLHSSFQYIKCILGCLPFNWTYSAETKTSNKVLYRLDVLCVPGQMSSAYTHSLQLGEWTTDVTFISGLAFLHLVLSHTAFFFSFSTWM